MGARDDFKHQVKGSLPNLPRPPAHRGIPKNAPRMTTPTMN